MKTLNLQSLKKTIIILLTFSLIFYSQKSSSQSQAADSENRIESLAQTSQVWNRFSVSLGGFLATYNSGIILGSKQLGLGLQIDIEDALGLKTTTFAFRGRVDYKFGKSKHIKFKEN